MARKMGLKRKSPTWRWGLSALERRNGPVLGAGLREVPCLGREPEGVWRQGWLSPGLLCSCKSCAVQEVKPKVLESHQQGSPQGCPQEHCLTPGLLARPFLCPSTCSSQGAEWGALELQLLPSPPNPASSRPTRCLYHEIVSITGPKTGLVLEAEEPELR